LWPTSINVGVEVCRIECQYVDLEIEALHRHASEFQLRSLELGVIAARGQPVKCEPGKRLPRQAAHPRHTLVEKLRQVPLCSRRTSTLQRDRQHHLSNGRALGARCRLAGSVDDAHHIKLLRDPSQSTDVTDAAGTHGPRRRQIYSSRCVRRSQYHLP
jgi:hypothetical protein